MDSQDLPPDSAALLSKENHDYLTRLNTLTVDWYKVADAKGQLLLTLDGAFVTIVATTVFAAPDELDSRLKVAGPIGQTLIVLAAGSIAFSIVCALLCLHSRISSSQLTRITHDEMAVRPSDASTYHAGIAGWFGHIATISKSKLPATASGTAGPILATYLQGIGRDQERTVLALGIVALSSNVLEKHRWVNRGWLLAGVSLLALVGFGLSYALGPR